MVLQKNSITIKVFDQNGDAIEGIKVNIQSVNGVYNESFTNVFNNTILDAKPGNYLLTFQDIPGDYVCPQLIDNFTLKQDGKIKLEYECRKK